MVWAWLARGLFVAAVAYAAVLLRPFHLASVPNASFGLALGLLIVIAEMRLRRASITHLLGALLGGAIGLGIAKTISAALFWTDATDPRIVFVHSFLLLVLPYLGLVIGVRRGEWLEPARLVALFRDASPERRHKILDTSVIIDGRIADICEAGFLDGTLVIPQFVLKELQLVADSPDALKRNRGRRGLDILQKMQKMSNVEVAISDADFPGVREVDLKLIELARLLHGKIVTNDFNLNKVAQLRGIQVLNINELANALKPVVLPGEYMKVFVLKEGKEYNQGVAYLEHRHRRHQRAADDGGEDDFRPLHRSGRGGRTDAHSGVGIRADPAANGGSGWGAGRARAGSGLADGEPPCLALTGGPHS
jgi:uncharacterized protein YacL